MATKRKAPPVVVAAATRVRLADKKIAQKQAAKRQNWQKEAWAYFHETPEVGYAVRWAGNSMAKLRLYAGVRPPGAPRDAPPVPVEADDSGIAPDLAAAAAAELERLKGPIGGLPQILWGLGTNFEVAGECYLVGYGGGAGPEDTEPDPDGENEEWAVRSVSEVDVKQGVYRIKESSGDTKGRVLDETRDAIVHLWQPDPEWSAQADSHVRSTLGELRALQVLSNQVIAEGMSRHNAGILLMPNGLSAGPPDPTTPDDGTDPTDKFFEDLLAALSAPIDDTTAASAVMPYVLRGELEQIAAVRHLLLGRTSDASLDARIEKRIERVARGLNCPVEVVMGHQQTTYANAAQVDQDAFEDHLEPRCLLICDALTIGFLRPQLVDAGWSEEEVNALVVWYDPSALIASPDVEKNAEPAFDRFAISGAAYRKAKGFGDEDEPEPLEILLRVALMKGGLAPEVVTAIIGMLDVPGFEAPEPPPPPEPFALPPAPAEEEEDEASLPARAKTNGHAALARRTTRPLGVRLMEIDRELRARLLVLTDRTMNRALERAANRQRNRQRSVEASRSKGVTAAVDPDELFEDAFDAMEEQFLAWGSRAQREALDLVGRAVGGFSTARRDVLGLRQAGDLAEAWEWLEGTLTALAKARLFDPSPAAPLVGELDPSLVVQPGLVRQAIARAGGAAGLQTNGAGGAWLTLADGGTRPAGGIGTGELVRDALRDEGGGVEAYEWTYGPAFRARPFEPHLFLDGAIFENFDADVLANNEGWPEMAFYMPGDHDGCLCDVTPVIVTPAELEG